MYSETSDLNELLSSSHQLRRLFYLLAFYITLLYLGMKSGISWQ
jgi:hypothetical protein